MKQLLIIISLVTGMFFSVKAQDDTEKKGGRLEALKIAYLTKKLDLSPQEAQKFWPIYNNYAAEIKNARLDQRENKTSEIDTEDKILNIRKKYNSEFSNVLTKEKVNTFFKSEKEFWNSVQKELQERRQSKQNNNLNQQRIPR